MLHARSCKIAFKNYITLTCIVEISGWPPMNKGPSNTAKLTRENELVVTGEETPLTEKEKPSLPSSN